MKLAAIFKDGMVLQRDDGIRIFGESEADDILKIEVDNISVESTIPEGWWMLELPEHPAGGPFEMSVSSKNDGDTVVIHDVYFGEVWLNNGQSNIEFALKDARGGLREIETADYPEIRYYNVPVVGVVGDELEQAEKNSCWKKVTGASFGDISAIGYYYAVMLYEKLRVPIGIIDCYKGGTSISCWMDYEDLESIPEGRIYLEEYESIIANQTEEEYEAILKEFNDRNEKHDRIVEELKAANPDVTLEEIYEKAGRYSWPPPLGTTSEFRPTGLRETMLKRVAPYTIKGIVYYQGEEDAVRNYNVTQETLKKTLEKNIKTTQEKNTEKYLEKDPEKTLQKNRNSKDDAWLDEPQYNTMYKNLLQNLIFEWETMFCNVNLPIVLVQLTMFIEYGQEDLRDWAYIREAQQEIVQHGGMDNLYLVPMLDMGEYDNVHPTDKRTPGTRVGEIMLGDIYRCQEYKWSPKVSDILFQNHKISIYVDDIYDGLCLMDNELINIREPHKEDKDSKPESGHVYGFEILLEDGSWVLPQSVKLYPERIDVEDDRLIYGVSYGFFNYGKVNVYNSLGLPLEQIRAMIPPRFVKEN